MAIRQLQRYRLSSARLSTPRSTSTTFDPALVFFSFLSSLTPPKVRHPHCVWYHHSDFPGSADPLNHLQTLEVASAFAILLLSIQTNANPQTSMQPLDDAALTAHYMSAAFLAHLTTLITSSSLFQMMPDQFRRCVSHRTHAPNHPRCHHSR